MDEASTSSSTDEKLCRICSLNTSEKLVLVTSKGKDSLKAASKERRDKLFSNIDNSENVYVHHTCRVAYIHKENVDVARKRANAKDTLSPTKKKLRRSSSSSVESASDVSTTFFDWGRNCFICENEASALKEKKKAFLSRRKIHSIRTLDAIQNFAKMLIRYIERY